MTVTELIERLEAIRAEEGPNIEVVLRDWNHYPTAMNYPDVKTVVARTFYSCTGKPPFRLLVLDS